MRAEHFFFVFFGLIAIAAVCMWVVEILEWNGGTCKESGLRWELFDHDSQGCRGYKDGAGHYCWISWPVDWKRSQ